MCGSSFINFVWVFVFEILYQLQNIGFVVDSCLIIMNLAQNLVLYKILHVVY